MHSSAELQRLYAELNMAFMRGQLGFLLGQSPAFHRRVAEGRLIIALGFVDLSTQAICLDVDSLSLNPTIAKDPSLTERVHEEFGVYSYEAARATVPRIDAFTNPTNPWGT
jgi:hypothetical protein